MGVGKGKEIYIKELECKVKKYKMQIETLKNILKATDNVII
ncbi:hypothetical protein [uncultured Clostridium sp.]|nr:hypothetical protein [uncultured Clostridium sp.]